MSNLESPGCSWYALQVRHQNEFKLSRIFFEKFGIKTLVPAQRVWKRRFGRKIVHTRPLIASYVFMMANLDALNKRLLYSLSGVFGMVCQGGVPAEIPYQQIQCLEKMSQSDKPVYEIELSKLKLNDRVEVIDGPLKGAVGNFIKIDNKTGQFVLSLDLFKRVLLTELEAEFVRPY